MNSIAKPLNINTALSFLEGLVFEAVDEFTKMQRSIDPWDIACHIEHTRVEEIVAFVKARSDFPAIVADDFLMSAQEIRACYADPALFPALVDACLFKHFKNLVEWDQDVTAILVRSHYIKADDDEHQRRTA